MGSVGAGLEPAPIRYRVLLDVSTLALLGLNPRALAGIPSAAIAGSTPTVARIPRASNAAGGGTGMMLAGQE
ncbi:hypothetical protein C1S80_03025 [Mycolicibacterium aubagnense]|nr:hypothetical protein C1S80_03025 [Mycolicibacterium aubagnense]